MQVCLMSDECSSVVSAALEFLHEEELILALIKHAITREVARTSPCSPPHITREGERKREGGKKRGSPNIGDQV